MRILTYNLWHGLAPSSAVTMTALEPSFRIRKRQKLLFEVLSQLEFDVGFFQEVNPISERSQLLGESLKKDFIFQPDLVGVKVLGLGLPGNLNSGLLTLAHSQFQMRKVQGLKLSGQGSSFVSSWLSFQLREERYALMGEILTQTWGRVLVVNTHLHHGLELTEELEKDLKEAAKDLSLSSSVLSDLMERVKRGNERRLREMKTLLNAVSKISDRYSMVVLGGDFNAQPDGELSSLFSEYGFKDSFKMQNEIEELNTFDPEANVANHVLQARFPMTVQYDDLTFSDQVRSRLNGIFSSNERKARRIDQIWIRSSSPFKATVQLVGLPESEGFAPSDHFGYVVDLK